VTSAEAREAAPRFPAAVDDALQAAGWAAGRWEMAQAEEWADTLRAHRSPGGHLHAVLPSAVQVWAEFGGLTLDPTGPGRQVAPTGAVVDPLACLHAARTLGDLGDALGVEICALGVESGASGALLAMDAKGRVYGLDHTGDWFLGADFDTALTTLLTGLRPARLSAGPHGPS
jgi:hypothetical protein